MFKLRRVSPSETAPETAAPGHLSSETQSRDAALMEASTSSSVNHRTPDQSEGEGTEAAVKTELATYRKVEDMSDSGQCPDTGMQLKWVLSNVEDKTDPWKCPDTGVQLKRVLGNVKDKTHPGQCPDTGPQFKMVLGNVKDKTHPGQCLDSGTQLKMAVGNVEDKTHPGQCLDNGTQLNWVLGNVEDKTDPGQCPDSEVQLKRVLGLWNGVGMIVGVMIGSGIFVSPKTVVEYTGSVGMALVVWMATGLLSMVGGLCYAELGTTIPRSGGSYVYILEAFGPVPAFLALWTNILVAKPASQAIVSLIFANYLLQAVLPDCSSPPYYSVRLLAAAMICLVMYINCIGVKLGTYVQDTLAMTKVVALIIIIVAGVQHLARGHVKHFLDPMKGTVWDVTSFATAFYSTLFAYSGWDSLTYVTEELKDPCKNLPRAIAISMSIVSVIYTLTNVAYYAVLTPAEILSSSAVAVTFGNRMLGALAWIIAFFVGCSTAGTTNGNLVTRSRMTFAGAREGHLPQFLTLIHISHSTPVPALILSAIVPLAALMADNVGALLAYTSFTNNLINLTAVLGLLWLRYKEPARPRPIKVWLGLPILYLVVSVFLTVFPVIRRPVEIAVALAIIGAGLIVYYFAIYLQSTPKCFTKIMEKVTRLCQLVFLCSPEAQCQRT